MRHNSIARAALVAALFISTVGTTGCASCSRYTKSWGSDISGGLDRTVTLYDYNGKVVKTWEGKIDLADTADEVWFDLDGKRVNVNGGIVVVEEH